MEAENYDWRYWPPPGGSSGSEEVTEKVASATPSYALPDLLNSIVSQAQSWSTGPLMKTAADEASKVTRQNIWRHRDASPSALMLLILDEFGEESMEWEAEALKLTLKRSGHPMSNSVWTKILAARTAITSPSPWKQWEVFHWVSLGLAGISPNFVYLEEPEVGHLISGYDFMLAVDPHREPQEDLDKFVAAAFRHAGILYAPDPLNFAQDEIEESKLRCMNCKAIHKNDNDVKCITCSSDKLEPIPYEYADVRDATMELFLMRRDMPTAKALDGLPETAAGNAAYQLLTHWGHAADVRANTIAQLRMIST